MGPGRPESVSADVAEACEALLERATGRDGSQMVIEDAMSAQFASRIDGFSKVRFERMRQGRHASRCFDPARPEKTDDDARWTLELGR